MQALLAKYDQPVPRYTSYPTAPHFKHAVGQADMRDRLSRLPAHESVSLYIHIPFCRHLCLYCGCHTKVVDHEAPIRDYMKLVQQEILLVAKALGRRQKVSHLHFGGGTPNFVPTQDLAATLNVIQREFSIPENLDIAMEMDPRILSREKIHDMRELGVNRVSLGVQDFHPDVQKAVNRIQPFEHVQDCVEALRAAGIGSINFDLIYGLPLQTPEKMRANVEKLRLLRPDRVALFGYAHVPWFKEHQKKLEAYHLPDAFERFEMAETARRALMDAGYIPVGIDHFARPGDSLSEACKRKTLRRNFQGYTTDNEDTLIGFGQTAISQYPGAYIQNTDGNREYREKVQGGEFPVAKACLLTAEDIYRRSVIEALMCYGEADLMALDEAYQWADVVWDDAQPALKALCDDGLVQLGDMDVAITLRGRPFTRVVASAFDAYLQKSTGLQKHAKAV